MELRENMRALVQWVWNRAETQGYSIDDHHSLFHETATEFNLYAGPDSEPSAPIWLSRVVAGVLQDRSEGLTNSDI